MDEGVNRFCVKQDGDLFSLFWMQENRDGTVAIYTATEDSHEGFSEGFGKKKLFREAGSASQRKFSVHPSIGRDGITITSQVILNNKKIRSKLLVDSDLPNLVSRIFTYLCPIMNERSAIDLKSKRGNMIEIANFSRNDKTAVIFSIVVTGKACRPVDIPGFHLTNFEISHFNFGIYVCYLNFPATDLGVMNTQMTFSPQVDNLPMGNVNMIKSPNEKLQFLPDFVRDSALRVAEHAIDINAERFPVLSGMRDIPIYFHPNLQDLRNGRAIRGF